MSKSTSTLADIANQTGNLLAQVTHDLGLIAEQLGCDLPPQPGYTAPHTVETLLSDCRQHAEWLVGATAALQRHIGKAMPIEIPAAACAELLPGPGAPSAAGGSGCAGGYYGDPPIDCHGSPGGSPTIPPHQQANRGNGGVLYNGSGRTVSAKIPRKK